MSRKNKKLILIKRLLIWSIYIYSGIILYSKKEYLFVSLINFSKVIYPLSIFWLQIRIKSKDKFLPINSAMSTSQLWFNLLPVLACLITVICTLLNALFFSFRNFI